MCYKTNYRPYSFNESDQNYMAEGNSRTTLAVAHRCSTLMQAILPFLSVTYLLQRTPVYRILSWLFQKQYLFVTLQHPYPCTLFLLLVLRENASIFTIRYSYESVNIQAIPSNMLWILLK